MHRACSVWADARQLQELFRFRGDTAVVLFQYDAGGFVQVDDAPVTAEVLPDPDGLRERRFGERLDRREACQEALVEWDGALHLDLLQHHLGNEYPPGIARSTPRKIPRVVPKPADQGILNLLSTGGPDRRRRRVVISHPRSLRNFALPNSANFHQQRNIPPAHPAIQKACPTGRLWPRPLGPRILPFGPFGRCVPTSCARRATLNLPFATHHAAGGSQRCTSVP